MGAGAGLAAATSDGALAMLGSTGMFDQDVLFTDLLVQGYDAGNTAGYAVLALSLMIAIASPEAWDSAADLRQGYLRGRPDMHRAVHERPDAVGVRLRGR